MESLTASGVEADPLEVRSGLCMESMVSDKYLSYEERLFSFGGYCIECEVTFGLSNLFGLLECPLLERFSLYSC